MAISVYTIITIKLLAQSYQTCDPVTSSFVHSFIQFWKDRLLECAASFLGGWMPSVGLNV